VGSILRRCPYMSSSTNGTRIEWIDDAHLQVTMDLQTFRFVVIGGELQQLAKLRFCASLSESGFPVIGWCCNDLLSSHYLWGGG
jgi:hypothetical protein